MHREHVGTLVTAIIATGVSAQGHVRFSCGETLRLTTPLQVAFFASPEVMVVT
jgi:hypothetical protein